MQIEGSQAAQHALARQQLLAPQNKNARNSVIENPPDAIAKVRSADSAQLSQTSDVDSASLTQALAETIEAPPTAVYGDDDLALLKNAWGTTAQSDGFASEYDFNQDGTISGVDLLSLLGVYGQEKPAAESEESTVQAYSTSDIVGLRAAWNLRDGDEGFRSDYDFNGDGVINGADLGQLLGRYGLAREGANVAGSLKKTSFEESSVPDSDTSDDSTSVVPPDDTTATDTTVADTPAPDESELGSSRPLDTSIDGLLDDVSVATDSALLAALLPEAELQTSLGTADPLRDAQDFSLLLNELQVIEEETRERDDTQRADIIADIRSAFTELLAQPIEARDSLSLLLGRLSQGSTLG